MRNARLVMNDLENIPLSLIVAWMGGEVLCGGNQSVQVASLWTFCLGRFMHSYAYKGKLPMIRALSFTAGFLSTFVMAENGAITMAFSKDHISFTRNELKFIFFVKEKREGHGMIFSKFFTCLLVFKRKNIILK